MFSHLYQRFLDQQKNKLFFTAHSHHFWPDCTRQAMLDYWDDAAKLVDKKWQHILGHVLPEVQTHISGHIAWPYPETIAFSPNTHDFILRVLSCLDAREGPLQIVSTDSEFYSFERQIRRLEEDKLVHVHRVPAHPTTSFSERLVTHINEIKRESQIDLIFVSQVFFNSGVQALDLGCHLATLSESAKMVVVDGYHGFMAVPTDWSEAANLTNTFYLAGSYKYAQAGEGACFMVTPKNHKWRPRNTGWFSSFSELENKQSKLEYGEDYARFMGSTMDFSPLYRLKAVFDCLASEGISVEIIHRYIQDLQKRFLQILATSQHPILNRQSLIFDSFESHGHFFTFQGPSAREIEVLSQQLASLGIITDYRSDRIRFGFGMHLTSDFDLEFKHRTDQLLD